MMPPTAQATPAPIHDIAGPVWFFPYPAWMVVAAGLAFLALVGLIFWYTRRKRPAPVLSARERALAALQELRGEASEVDPYGFGVRVSDALRTYIRDQHGLDAVTRTSVEFLEVLRDNAAFTTNEKAAISEFLESVDLLKYARQAAAAEEIQTLLEIAERVVRGESPRQTVVSK
jgi:Domain of unknown function (DUF4381)